ncbi:EAL domain-containing protein [Nitrosomonas ureae]|uniref:Diguanylate cyclase/phosphodiesterase with PAS/PAC sensor(S) n=1 Tax=Nitrosomonas ureae TaxID=44577 RepID=A0A1H5SR52_9PROT|nr:EAL domain-containing protein [Nitrosomonas ureae]SEF53076.1 diguanylate cyclase/phosphodiesterase with PAS/PAC sensor(s) [Nitrosomonas ureae]
MNSQSPPPNRSGALLAEQIKLTYQQAPKALFVTLIVATMLAYIFWGLVGENWLLGWLAAIYVLTLGRFLMVKAYFRKMPSAAESVTWGRQFFISILLAGILWGSAGSIFFVADSAIHQLFLAYLLGGMIAGAMATLSSYKGAFLAFSVPVALPFTYQVIMHESDIQMIIALTYLLFVLTMSRISHQLHQTVTDSLKFRFDNVELLKRLIQTKNQLEQRVAERTEALTITNDILHQEKELFQITLASISDAVITTDTHGKITFLNPTAEIFTGWSNAEMHDTSLQNVFNIMDIATHKPAPDPLIDHLNELENSSRYRECILIHRDKKEYIIDYAVAPIQDEQKHMIGAVITFRDVTEQRKLTLKLAYQAAHDSLTGLLNRKEFENRLSKILTSIRKNDMHALLYLDLDQFKIINDSCGHSAGDKLLRQVTALLHSKLRARDTLARLGGDEFGVILEHCPRDQALQVADTLRELVQNFRFQWRGKTFTIGVSIGLFPITHENQGLEHALNAADSACYAAKEQGRNRVQIYQSVPHLQDSVEMQQWLPRIQNALTEQRFQLYYQPIQLISPEHTEQEQHGEILLRLQDENGQLIMPGAFLPAAGRHDQILLIDRWVVQRSLQLIKAHAAHTTNAIYTVNISGQALVSGDFLDFTVSSIKASQLDPACICFEISEQTALNDLQHVVRFVTTLKELGCRISIDDFSSNLSSFSYLKDIPLDYLKIDGRLIKNMLTDPINQAMVESIHHIGHIMRLKTIAVWVENDQTLQILENIGVDYVQGFWVAEPTPLNAGLPSTDKKAQG